MHCACAMGRCMHGVLPVSFGILSFAQRASRSLDVIIVPTINNPRSSKRFQHFYFSLHFVTAFVQLFLFAAGSISCRLLAKQCISACGRFCTGEVRPSYAATIGVDFQVQTVVVEDQTVCIQLWDTAGKGNTSAERKPARWSSKTGV